MSQQSQTPIELSTAVAKATVFVDRARVIRAGSVTLPIGTHKVKLVGLPSGFVKDTFRVRAKSAVAAVLLDVKSNEENYAAFPADNIQFMHQKVQAAAEAVQMVNDQLAILDKKRDFLEQIRLQSADQIGKDMDIQRPTVADWQNILDFIGQNHQQLDGQKYILTRQKREKEAEWTKLNADLKQLSGGLNKTRTVGWVLIENPVEQEIHFEVEYQVTNARWRPYYDVRADSERKKVQVVYYGEVTQTTAEDWTEVEIRLSTSRPALGKGLPDLHASQIFKAPNLSRVYPQLAEEAFLEDEEVPRAKKSKGAMMAAAAPMAMDEEVIANVPGAKVESAQGASVVFLVPGLSDVPGDGSQSRLQVMEEEFDGEFEYMAVPKMEDNVYVHATVKNTTDFPLLPGTSQVFLNGDFLSQGKMANIVMPDEEIHLELGVEEGIRLTYKFKDTEGKDRGLISKSKRWNYDIEILAENLLKVPVSLIIRDQVPISRVEEVVVKVEELSPAENPNKDKDELAEGIVEWKNEVAGGAKQKYVLRYFVESPSRVEWLIQ